MKAEPRSTLGELYARAGSLIQAFEREHGLRVGDRLPGHRFLLGPETFNALGRPKLVHGIRVDVGPGLPADRMILRFEVEASHQSGEEDRRDA